MRSTASALLLMMTFVHTTGCAESPDSANDEVLALVQEGAQEFIGSDGDLGPLECPDLTTTPGSYRCTSLFEGEELEWNVDVNPPLEESDSTDYSGVSFEPSYASTRQMAEVTIRAGFVQDYSISVASVTCPEIAPSAPALPISGTCEVIHDGIAFDVAYQGTPDDLSYLPESLVTRSSLESYFEESIAMNCTDQAQVVCSVPSIVKADDRDVYSCRARMMATDETALIEFTTDSNKADAFWNKGSGGTLHWRIGEVEACNQ